MFLSMVLCDLSHKKKNNICEHIAMSNDWNMSFTKTKLNRVFEELNACCNENVNFFFLVLFDSGHLIKKEIN